MPRPISGFSKLSKAQKIEWLTTTYFDNPADAKKTLETYWHAHRNTQQLHDDFIENTLTNYYLPYGVAPNFLINKTLFALPMATEESSVVAAASNAAKFWLSRGGFKAKVLSTVKNGQIHIDHYGGEAQLANFFARVKPKLLASIAPIEKNMKKRGGGLLDLQLKNSTAALEGHYQLHATFETKNAMGANFINSCLEQMAHTFETEAQHFEAFKKNKKMPRALMSILSNYVPECMVRAEVSCRTAHLKTERADGETFAKNFVRAVQIANTETRRAVTHNKGIMNGIDAVVIATGNDFRAVEAGAHAHACKNGRYTSLTKAEINDGVFRFWIELPLAVGTVGGLTGLHPLVRFSMQLLQGPTAEELMQYVAVAGLAQNFAAVRSLITTGIQKGHMKMHLMNILNQCNATHTEKEKAVSHFADRPVSQPAVKGYIRSIR